MRRQTVLLTVLFYLFGTAGIPVVAYSCIESGQAGLSHLSESSCYVDTCCEEEQGAQDTRLESASGCCQLDIQGAPESDRLLLPIPKYGSGELIPRALDHPGASLPDTRVVSVPPPIPAFHVPIALPLLS